MLNIIQKKFSYLLVFLSKRIYREENSLQSLRVRPWTAAKGDHTLRLNYENLNEDSIILDVGGYQGQWASDIFSKYLSNIFIFEPIKEYADNIYQRFGHNKKIRVLNYGLGAKNSECFISHSGDNSSLYKGKRIEKVKIITLYDFMNHNNINQIDLMKVNIEGSEYDLLENIIENNLQIYIKNIQVQFHDFLENAEDRMLNIQQKLQETHYLSYQFKFVWENWCVK